MMEALSSSKSRFLQEPHGVTSQKTPFLTLMSFGFIYNNTVIALTSGRFTGVLRARYPSLRGRSWSSFPLEAEYTLSGGGTVQNWTRIHSLLNSMLDTEPKS
jgi:hypothetical protein